MSGVSVLAPEGEIDLHATESLKDELNPILAAAVPRLLVDMSAVTYVDSSALALLIEAMQRAQAGGGAFGLCALRESVRHVFAIARLDHVFQIFATKDEALAALAG